MSKIRLEVKNISKSFPGVKALDGVNFSVKEGSVHVLCGENGAGKSTLMKIINGIYSPDSGKIYLNGKPISIKGPLEARSHGIQMIFQELNYIPEMTVEESLFLGNWPKTKSGQVDWKTLRKMTVDLLKKENLSYHPQTQLKNLSVSDIQMLEILKAVSYGADIIIMDEPTSAITQNEVQILFDKIAELKQRGTSIIYISHKMDEIFRIGDEITVFRDGCVVDSRDIKNYTLDLVISQMVGREIKDTFPKRSSQVGGRILEVKDFRSPGLFEDINFHLNQGEILGFSGLMGAGRTEVMRALFGLDPQYQGEIWINGQKATIRSSKDAIAYKMAMLSEDRRRFGIIPMRSIKENAALSNLKRFIHSGYLHKEEEKQTILSYFSRMKVKAPDLDTSIDTLSGGNQQKVILSKWMITQPDILILDEPTRGIDVGAKQEIYQLIDEIARNKKSLILISSELPELIGLCDRVYVMAKGRIQGELSQENLTQEKIMYLATTH